jgi:2-polyprenyl-6-methoxyphenol hydroxylase-like FAD-dependent oxidoreductase
MENHLGHHAVVIGGSVAGLMTARVLANHFDHVTVLERDHIERHPALHKSIPQGNHLHALLLSGQRVMSSLYPDFTAKLHNLGAVRVRVGEEMVWYLPEGKAYTPCGTPVRAPQYLGFDLTCHSRGLLEHCVRQCTLALANVQVVHESVVQRLMYDNGRVQGVRYEHEGGTQALAADLVVDAGGRGSYVPHWLTELGFGVPEETTLGVDLAYSSTKFRVPASYDEPDRLMLFFGLSPQLPSGGIMEEIEDKTWHVTLVGRFGEYPPTDAAGFLAFAQALYCPKLYELIKEAERVADIVSYRFPTSVHRHYERLTAFPEGLLVLGDAICSFNPVYGQGMSVAALQVKALQQLLRERAAGAQGLEGLALAFFPRAADEIVTPWTLAATQDLAYPQTRGERPPNLEESAQYFAALNALAAEDGVVHRLLAEVFHLVKPLAVLMEEPLRSRVVAHQGKQAGA